MQYEQVYNINIHHSIFICVCREARFFSIQQTITSCTSRRPDSSALPFFLLLLFCFLSLDIYLRIYLSPYPYIDLSIYLFYVPDFLSLVCLSPNFTSAFVRAFVPLYFPSSVFTIFIFCTRVVFAATIYSDVP